MSIQSLLWASPVLGNGCTERTEQDRKSLGSDGTCTVVGKTNRKQVNQTIKKVASEVKKKKKKIRNDLKMG